MMPPVEDLLLRIVEIEESFHRASVPSCERRETAGKRDNSFGAATLNRTPAEALLNVGNLNGINIDSHHRVMGGEPHGSAASGRNAEDMSARLKGTELNFGILIHAAE